MLPKVRLRDASEVFGLALSPDGQFIAIGSQGKSPQPHLLRVRNLSTGQQLYELALPSVPSSLVFTLDSQRLIVGGHQLKVLDAATGRVISEGGPEEHELAISQDARLALSIGHQGPRVVDLVEQKEIAVLQGKNEVTSAAFSTDGRYVTTWGYGSTTWGYGSAAIVFDATNGQELFSVPHEDEGGVMAATFSPDGRYLASGSKEHICTLLGGLAGYPKRAGQSACHHLLSVWVTGYRSPHAVYAPSALSKPNSEKHPICGNGQLTFINPRRLSGASTNRLTHTGASNVSLLLLAAQRSVASIRRP